MNKFTYNLLTNAVNTSEFNVRYFLKHRIETTEESGLYSRQKSEVNQLESLSGKCYIIDKNSQIEKDWNGRGAGNKIKTVPIQIATEFWIIINHTQ